MRKEWPMSSTTSQPKARDDDFFDFLFCHHVRSEREGRCFSFKERHVCSRCFGWFIGASFSSLSIWISVLHQHPIIFLLPIPAFIDWGGRKLEFFNPGKRMAFATGLLMGISLPFFFLGMLGLDPLAFGGAILFICLYGVISFLFPR